MTGRAWIVGAVLLAAASSGVVRSADAPLLTSPTYTELSASLGLPPSWESRVIYHRSFDAPDGVADINREGLEETMRMEVGQGGVLGRCGVPTQAKGLKLSGAALSPHLPLVVSFWWSPVADADKDTSFSLIHLASRRAGFISHFTRTGPWCGLTQAAAVLQVYDLPEIQNVNGIYDYQFFDHHDLRAGVWHHTALVITGGSNTAVYTDGVKVFEVLNTGRHFSPEDLLDVLILGPADYGPEIAIDEVTILNRPLSPAEIADYVRGMRQLGAR